MICTNNHDFGDDKPYKDIVFDKVTKYQEYNVVYLSKMDKNSISKVIKDFEPDILYLNSFFSKTTQLVMLLNKFTFKKKLVVAPRGELQENALNIKKTKKLVYLFIYKLFGLYKNTYFHSTDAIETKSIKELFQIDNITQLQNAVKIRNFEPLTKNANELKIIFVSRIARKKNLLFALKLLQNLDENIIFDIYGPKEDREYWNECQSIIDELPANIHVSYKGSLTQSEIVNKMREYHCFLFPTLSENFGHVIVEAMQAGLVPIISDQTPWRALKAVNAGWDVSLEDEPSYVKAIKALHVMDGKEYSKKSLAIMEYIHNKLDMDKLALGYASFFNKIIEEK